MAELSARRLVAIAALTGALVGGTVAGVAAVATANGNSDKPTLSSGGDRSVTTAPVVRTTLTTSVQEGGSIGYEGSYTVAEPAGTSDEQVGPGQEAVTQDQQALTADQTAESDTSASDTQALAAAQTNSVTALPPSARTRPPRPRTAPGRGRPARPAARTARSQRRSDSADPGPAATGQRRGPPRPVTRTKARPRSPLTRSSSEATKPRLASGETTAQNPVTTYTALPRVGEVISQDQSVYSVSNEAVPLLYGSIAAYRGVLRRHVRRRRCGRADPGPDRPRLRRRADPEQPLLLGHRRRGRTLAERARSAGDRRDPARRRWSSSPAPSGSPRSRRRSARPSGVVAAATAARLRTC